MVVPSWCKDEVQLTPSVLEILVVYSLAVWGECDCELFLCEPRRTENKEHGKVVHTCTQQV